MALQFGDFTLDEATRGLRRGAEVVHISPKAFQLLALLIAQRPKAISKSELQQKLWPSSFVVEANLGNLVAEARAALDDDPKSPQFIRTVYGFGYSFCGEAREIETASLPAGVEEVHARPVNRRRWGPILLGILSISVLVVALSLRAPDHRRQRIDSIAVLPFRVTGGASRANAADTSYLTDGITESLISNLSMIPNLRVISMNSVSRFAGMTTDAQAAGRQLDVAAVMTGRIDAGGERLVVNTELIDTADGSVILSRRYEAPMDDLVALQSTIVQDVISRIGANPGADQQRILAARETADAEAYRLRLQGQFYARRIDPQSQHQAIKYFEQAVARDPGYARAYANMSRAYLLLAIYFEAPNEMTPLARRYVQKALQLDNSLTDAHVNLGVINLLFDWDSRAARKELMFTSGLLPEAVETFSCSAHLLESTGAPFDAEKQIRHALLLDPLSSMVTAELGCNSYYQRRYDQAILEYRKSLELEPRNVLGYYGLGRAYGQKKMYGQALSELNKVEVVNGFVPPIILAEMGYVYGRSGETARSNAMLRRLAQLEEKSFVDPFLSAVIHTSQGNTDEAFTWLEKAYQARSGFMVSLKSDPKFDAIRADPRFADLTRRMGI